MNVFKHIYILFVSKKLNTSSKFFSLSTSQIALVRLYCVNNTKHRHRRSPSIGVESISKRKQMPPVDFVQQNIYRNFTGDSRHFSIQQVMSHELYASHYSKSCNSKMM